MSEQEPEDGTEEPGGEDAWVQEVPDGAGCTEIWDHLSEQRESTRDDE